MIITMKPLVRTFQLAESPEVEVTVRQASEDENIQRADLFAKSERIFGDDEVGEVRVKQEYNRRKLHRKEAYLTLASISNLTDENGDELFKVKETKNGTSISKGMKEAEFNEAWGLLPATITEEIVGFVHAVNVTWDPDHKGE